MKRKGVSLLETIMAAAILSGSVMMVCSLSGRSLRSVRLNQEYEKAWDTVNRQMVLIDEVGVESLVEVGGLNGQFKSPDGQSWQWTAQAEETEIEMLYDVVVEVQWLSGGRVCSVQCQSRLVGEVVEIQEEQESGGENSGQPMM
ncbi:MAG: type IV pilus modification PilV family protein [Planctomycetota bacterium]|jgi:hypothetical protein